MSGRKIIEFGIIDDDQRTTLYEDRYVRALSVGVSEDRVPVIYVEVVRNRGVPDAVDEFTVLWFATNEPLHIPDDVEFVGTVMHEGSAMHVYATRARE